MCHTTDKLMYRWTIDVLRKEAKTEYVERKIILIGSNLKRCSAMEVGVRQRTGLKKIWPDGVYGRV